LWDAPTRLFHWSLALAVSVAIVTAQVGGEWMEIHGLAGLSILGLVVFRVVWGFVGSTHSRFASFWPTPGRLRAYLQGRWRGVGHNPLGALSIFVLLAFLATQAGTGLFSNDDIAFTGPLAEHVSDDLSKWLTGWHHRLSNVLYVLIGLHIVAIAVYVGYKKQDLLRPMITGDKEVDATEPAPRRAGWLALVVAVIAALAAVYLANGGGRPWRAEAPAAQQPAKPAW
jgi:cytochrome b